MTLHILIYIYIYKLSYFWQLVEYGGLHENIEEIRQGKVVLPQLFSIYVHVCMEKRRAFYILKKKRNKKKKINLNQYCSFFYEWEILLIKIKKPKRNTEIRY
jgi:hypothetical protein